MISKGFLPKKIDRRSENLNLLFAIVIFLGVAAFIYFNNHSRLNELKQDYSYTIGTIRDFSPSRTGRLANYTFSYNQDAFVGGYTFYRKDYERFTIGKKFLVIFSPSNPEIKFLIPISIPEETSVPKEGWKTPPPFINEENVWKYLESNF